MRDTVSNTPVPDPHVPHTLVHARPQPASPAVIKMDDSLNDTKESQRKMDTEESVLESSSALSDNPEDTTNPPESDVEPMDISNKTATTVDSDHQSNCSSPGTTETKYFCPVCEISLTSQHDFTLHIRSHNNDNDIIPEKGFTCCICSKVLSSSSSLDRHTLVHSGERPFRCKICQVTFTTNGNMHRHMRTHSQKAGENYESDGSTDSGSSINSTTKNRKRRLEFNNNKLVDNSNKRKSDCLSNDNDDNGNSRRKTKNLNNNNVNESSTQRYQCPVCDREDFASLNVLQTHMEDSHPYYEVRCTSCNLSFKNYRALNLHMHMVHYTDTFNDTNHRANKNPHLGFKDLTFVDFSSNKFPHIARYECEKNMHKPITVQKFICDKCHLAFPCSSALQIHQEECLKSIDGCNEPQHPTDLSKASNMSDEETCRDSFFAHLNLQNKSSPTSPTSIKAEEDSDKSQKIQRESKPITDTKDLADIQSILSMTSNGSLLQHLRTKPPSELLPKAESNRVQEQPAEEESQDVFAAEFRKMKLRGEFPCRLCSAIFPNLRALKGHNRAHLTGSGNTGPYRCNMCPHSSMDKAALIRHMRTHNGDRPYECSLCNYAFTTKANCERHLRNRHAKVTREEVKKAIIYHPSEDPTNDEINKLSSSRTDAKHSFATSTTDDESRTPDKATPPIAKDCVRPELRNLMLPQTLGILPPNIMSKDLSVNLSIPKETSPSLKVNKEISTPNNVLQKDEQSAFDFRKRMSLSYQPEASEKLSDESLIPKIHVKNIDGLKQIPDYDTHSDGEDSSNNMSSSFEDYQKMNEHPMDLSMDVLDLSTKKDSAKAKSDDEPQDFTKKTLESSPTLPQPHTAAQLILAQQLLKNPNLYLHPLSPYCLSNLPHNPYQFLFPPTFMNSPEMKERMLRLQLSGGTMISDQFSALAPNGMQPFHSQTIPNIPDIKYPISKPESELKPPLHINTQLADSIAKLQSPKPQPKTADLSQSPNSVKMVIKNGVLMPKQKQRRYRTERPFSCEHCSARFTLRSNMERHIKQQHPQYWSQRQRAGLTGVGRKPSSTPPSTVQGNSKQQYYDLNIPNYDIPKIIDSKETKDKDSSTNHNISQQVKYAILAQQLKAHSSDPNYSSTAKEKPVQDEDEDALVIDEENPEEKPMKQETKDILNEIKVENEKMKSLDMKMQELRQLREKEIKTERCEDGNLLKIKTEEAGQDLVPVSRLLDNAVSSQLPFREYFRRDGEDNEGEGVSEEDEEGLVASGSTSEGNGSGSDENKSENENTVKTEAVKKKSAYSLAPNRVSCQYCHRKFPWTSSLRRHVLTHTGQKPFKCPQCPLLFTTKSNCDRHLLRKHGNNSNSNADNTNNNNNNSQNYMMRNVPERPYKCSSCPSSTFATLSNLKKHMSCKHTTNNSSTEQQRPEEAKSNNDCEGTPSSEDERANKQGDAKSEWETQIAHSKVSLSADGVNIQNADLPFKCHLCEGSYAERQEALDHIKEIHVAEYELLMAKGALDQSASGHDEVHTSHETEEDDHLRGRFPDYANRKVMCAFCMRRFWSAEDLRRHMRTHTGERPFSCDVCNRRFTLKHSMLRHRKKHNLSNSHEDNSVLISGDEEPTRVSPYDSYSKINNNNSLVSKGADKSSEEDSEGNEGNDLIGNLLGIRDKSIIDQVLISSADDAAKLLGVKRGQE